MEPQREATASAVKGVCCQAWQPEFDPWAHEVEGVSLLSQVVF